MQANAADGLIRLKVSLQYIYMQIHLYQTYVERERPRRKLAPDAKTLAAPNIARPW